ncbi:hypothetical protein B0H39_003308 [Clostridium beijerinckii]|uniref:DUF2442 domain-containing protein n=1 Tax=Clostridium beijerinckii TaxID=1520 RepID=UPI001494CD8C|nr:DUF2442 domain-containing protein [Clostridium beijerinckii]NOW85418.1 hypothetical protein [Clostridium beijerinckii]NOW85427.1 hypothetical protein [Clostridium beijerinckii]
MEYMPEVIQVRPTNDFKVYVYFDDGSIKLYDAKELINKGIFTKVKDINVFKETCTVLNGTLAWDLDGNYNENTCLDIDPFEIYENSLDVDE